MTLTHDRDFRINYVGLTKTHENSYSLIFLTPLGLPREPLGSPGQISSMVCLSISSISNDFLPLGLPREPLGSPGEISSMVCLSISGISNDFLPLGSPGSPWAPLGELIGISLNKTQLVRRIN